MYVLWGRGGGLAGLERGIKKRGEGVPLESLRDLRRPDASAERATYKVTREGQENKKELEGDRVGDDGGVGQQSSY